MSKQVSLLLIICYTIALIVAVITGVFLWFVPAWLLTSLLVATAAGVAGLLWGGVMALWNWASRLSMIYPDENGNYPIKAVKRWVVSWRGVGLETSWINLNLTGATDYQKWATWQITNNRGGSQPRELLSGLNQPQPELPLIVAPGQSLVIDAISRDLK
jgi:hypothetical protein